jgi:PPOX class probable F420-dependent enzyme
MASVVGRGEDGCVTTLSDPARDLIEQGRLAHLVTLNADGSAQVSIVWVGLDGDELVTGHLSPTQHKLRNIRRDPRVVLSLEAGTRNEHGLDEYLVVHGTARLVDGGAPELLQRLAEVYLGPGVKFPPMDDPPPGTVCRIEVDRVGGVGPWAG